MWSKIHLDQLGQFSNLVKGHEQNFAHLLRHDRKLLRKSRKELCRKMIRNPFYCGRMKGSVMGIENALKGKKEIWKWGEISTRK